MYNVFVAYKLEDYEKLKDIVTMYEIRVPVRSYQITVMILSFRTDMPGQTVQTQIRLLLEEQSDQGLYCLPFRLHRLDSLYYGRATEFKF